MKPHALRKTYLSPLFCLYLQGFGTSSSPIFHKFKGMTKLLVIRGIFIGIYSLELNTILLNPWWSMNEFVLLDNFFLLTEIACGK